MPPQPAVICIEVLFRYCVSSTKSLLLAYTNCSPALPPKLTCQHVLNFEWLLCGQTARKAGTPINMMLCWPVWYLNYKLLSLITRWKFDVRPDSATEAIMNKPYSQNSKIKQQPSPLTHINESCDNINWTNSFYCALIVSFLPCVPLLRPIMWSKCENRCFSLYTVVCIIEHQSVPYKVLKYVKSMFVHFLYHTKITIWPIHG